jgi:SsrA-binding protein
MVAKTEAEKKQRVICEHRRARHDYTILDTLEAGVSLLGSEVKALRGGGGNIKEAHVRFEDGEVWLIDSNIPAYEHANRQNHEPRRRRKLLIKSAEAERWHKRVKERGLTCIALRMYFVGPWVKVEVALAKGKRLHDKRATLRERADARDMDRAMKQRD